jgi:hypothetical protein
MVNLVTFIQGVVVEGQVKYLVRVQCDPSPVGYEEEIVQALRDDFNVARYSCTSTGFTLEVRSEHPLAYGVFKDVADLVKETLIERNLRLLSGAIHRVERNSLSAAVDAFILRTGDSVKGTRNGVLSFRCLDLLQKFVDGPLGGTRLVPVMFFYGEMFIDLVLSAKARRLAMRTVPEPN